MPPLLLTDRSSLVKGLRIWINHKRILSQKSNFYKQKEVARSLSKVHSLFLVVKRDCPEYGLKRLCALIIQHEEDLFKILPAKNNDSYTTQEEKLYNIIQFAKKQIQP